MSEIESKVKAILVKELLVIPFSPDKIELSHRLNKDLAADSLDLVCVGMEIEKEFGILISDNELDLIETVGDLIEMVEKSIVNK